MFGRDRDKIERRPATPVTRHTCHYSDSFQRHTLRPHIGHGNNTGAIALFLRTL
ncbi:hypothetical protein [Thermoleptolyngbya sp. C42_A2020_037]|uniref:hypothetical protein n=1 Tax=Thermoleptolyngbya sp. C42_A2020_037 TaxID=2747799 RepID=UPI001A03793C|nr:hypothetical protein [Thermoleptolyngbya sp. C42_A2020_037]MBF2086985.1 hypothetical protein [Thermoleptolyngbya sp. C42_A2020_037]